MATWMGAGLIIGIGIGAAMDNIGAGIAIGVALGAGMARAARKRSPKEPDQT